MKMEEAKRFCGAWIMSDEEEEEMIMFMRDFTMAKYKELCLALLDSGYTPLTVCSYLTGKQKKKNNNNKLVVLRHDIDSRFSHHQ